MEVTAGIKLKELILGLGSFLQKGANEVINEDVKYLQEREEDL